MLTSNHLVSPTFSLDALLLASTDKTFSVFFHDQVGSVDVASGTANPQTISSLLFPDHILTHAISQFNLISQSVDVRFNLVFSEESADIVFYFDSEIDLGDHSSTTLGLALNNYDFTSGRRWIEIFFNGPELLLHSSDLHAYVFNHELLHALGLEHTFDNSDGDFYLSTDPLLSATPEQTVMSYIKPLSGVYPTDLTHHDYSALLDIWGPADPSSITTLNPSSTSVYRLFNVDTSQHLYTTNDLEIDIITGASESSPYINEGIAYVVTPGANVDLYRFYNLFTGRHFYTANKSERDLILNSSIISPLFYEGVAFKVFSPLVSSPNLDPVYRFFDPVNSTHFYTASSFERDSLAVTHPHWISEGIAWYA